MRMLWRSAAVVAVSVVVLGGSAIGADAQEDERGPEDAESAVAAGTLDDGQELLPLAQITLEQAIAAAQGAAAGAVGEVDLEYVGDRLVFNVDIGAQDVKIDAGSGEIVSVNADD